MSIKILSNLILFYISCQKTRDNATAWKHVCWCFKAQDCAACYFKTYAKKISTTKFLKIQYAVKMHVQLCVHACVYMLYTHQVVQLSHCQYLCVHDEERVCESIIVIMQLFIVNTIRELYTHGTEVMREGKAAAVPHSLLNCRCYSKCAHSPGQTVFPYIAHCRMVCIYIDHLH